MLIKLKIDYQTKNNVKSKTYGQVCKKSLSALKCYNSNIAVTEVSYVSILFNIPLQLLLSS